jgi:hypothetical protein
VRSTAVRRRGERAAGVVLIGLVAAVAVEHRRPSYCARLTLRAGKGAWGVAGIGAAGRNRCLLVAGIAAALVLLVVVGRVQQDALPVAEPPTRTTLPVLPATVAARSLHAAARVHIGPPPVPTGGEVFPVAVGEGAVWVVLHGELVRVDPSRNRVAARIRVSLPEQAVDVLLAGGRVWVATSAGVVGVDPWTGRVLGSVPISGRGGPVAPGDGSLWWQMCEGPAGAGRCRLLRRAPPTLAVAAVVSVPEAVVPGIAVQGGSAWVLSGAGPRLWRLRLAGGAPARLALPLVTSPAPAEAMAHATAVASGFGAVWVLTDLYAAAAPSGTRIGPALLRIDPASGQVAAALPLADLDRPVALAIAAGSVWVQGWQIHHDATASVVVERVDPAGLRVVEAFDAGGDADSRMAVGLGSLWVTRPASGDLLRVDAGG